MASRTPKRPMAKVQRLALISRRISERLGLAAAELLLSRAARVSEGQMLPDGHYYGSTMLTINLEELAASGLLSDACDVSTTSKVCQLMAGSESVSERARVIAHQEAARLAKRAVTPTAVDVGVRAEGTTIFIDIDVEGSAEKSAIETVG